MTQAAWITSHPYLQSVASLDAEVNKEIAEITAASPEMPAWDNYTLEFHAGVPLLWSAAVPIDCTPAEKMIRSKVEQLTASAMPQIADEIRIIDAELRGEFTPRRVVAWLLEGDPVVSRSPGLLRYLGWTALSQYLRPLVDEFAKWRGEDRWLRSYCPTCGSPPAMAQLVGSDPGRQRFLSCGRCSTRWRYQRTKCPFCESQDDHQISIVTVEGEGGLRIDYCESCRGYLKTYDGEGNEAVMLVDWTSIHLDVIARDRGLKRLAASLYEL